MHIPKHRQRATCKMGRFMIRSHDANIFTERIARIHAAAGTRTQTELAGFLGIRQSSVSDAKRRSVIPAGWLLVLLQVRNTRPEWILTGKGPRYMDGDGEEPGAMAGLCGRAGDAALLRRVPSRLLAEEMLRRIATAGGC